MITFTIDKKQLERLTEKIRSISPTAENSITRKAFTDLTLETEKQLKLNTASILHVRSGRLRSSISSRVYERGKDLIGEVGSGVRQGDRVPYANIHETGGVIRPVNKKYLAIPLPPALTSAGVLRQKPRDYANTFVAKSNAGNLIIFQRTLGKGAIALFVLKKSVTIPRRRYMSRTVEEIAPRAFEIMNRSIERELAKT